MVNFTPGGVQVNEIKGKEPEFVAKQIAQLGEDGWEMVSCHPDVEPSYLTFYFKRHAL